MIFQPRPYQEEALEALHNFICTKDTNPCVVIPTGGGRSALIAWAIQRWREDCPWFRVVILAHRKELIEQNAAELAGFCPDLKIGVYSAGLKKRDMSSDIIFASIDSVYDRASLFLPFDVIMIDEAHRVPASGEGKYRKFITGCRKKNKDIRVIGWTATPFRMNCGPICHKDHILNEVCYEASITDLIRDGFLSPLRTKVGESQPDLKGVKRNSGGDYITKSLMDATGGVDVVNAAVTEAVRIMNAEERHSAVFFCVSIEHCEAVSAALLTLGITAPSVTSKTSPEKRERIADAFKSGEIRAICNVNVYTEGFNAKCIDCIVLLRPTLSAGLFSQMVGRGLRLHPNKRFCLILDFASCIEEHGPIDMLGNDRVVLATCRVCRESFSRAVRICPGCGWEIPKRVLEKLEAEEAERRLHGAKASAKAILSGAPVTLVVDDVFLSRHIKPGSPDSLKVQYRCGLDMHREWICLEHPGFAGKKAQAWWHERFSSKGIDKGSVEDVVARWESPQLVKDYTKTITVKKSGKYTEIIGYNE